MLYITHTDRGLYILCSDEWYIRNNIGAYLIPIYNKMFVLNFQTEQ